MLRGTHSVWYQISVDLMQEKDLNLSTFKPNPHTSLQLDWFAEHLQEMGNNMTSLYSSVTSQTHPRQNKKTPH